MFRFPFSRIAYFFVYFDGKLITSNDNLLAIHSRQTEIKAVSLEPNQEIDYSFNWNLANIQQGTYSRESLYRIFAPTTGAVNNTYAINNNPPWLGKWST